MASCVQEKIEGGQVRNLILAITLLFLAGFVHDNAQAASAPGSPYTPTTTSAPLETLDPMQDYLSGLNGHCGVQMLPTSANQQLKFISPLVHCFQNIITSLVTGGTTIGPITIPGSGGILQNMANNLKAAVNAAMVIYVIIFGVKITTGMINNPRQEVFMHAIKLAFVAWLINGMGIMDMWYMTLGAYESMLGVVITPATLTACPMTAVLSIDLVWDTMDCLFGKIIGWNTPNGYNQTWQGVALLFSTLVAKASQGGGGYLIAAFIANSMLTILFSFLQIAMAYIISMLGLMLMFSLAPLALPCMFFRVTYNYFEAWYKMIISFILQVVVLFAFTAFAFGIIDQIYSGPDGLEAMFGGTKISNEVTRTDTLGTNTMYWQNFEAMFTGAMEGKGDITMVVNFVSLLVLGYLMLSFITIAGQIAHEISGASSFPNLMSSSGHGMNFAIPKV